MEGEPRDIPVGIDASAYRIVQEGLTNELKHAGDNRLQAAADTTHAPLTP
jgi:signal transduction histidine kinase